MRNLGSVDRCNDKGQSSWLNSFKTRNIYLHSFYVGVSRWSSVTEEWCFQIVIVGIVSLCSLTSILFVFPSQKWNVSQTKIRVTSTVLFILFGCLLFVAIPAIIFQHIEGWSTLESIYFVVITLTTIGFGDFVAGSNWSRCSAALLCILMSIICLFSNTSTPQAKVNDIVCRTHVISTH